MTGNIRELSKYSREDSEKLSLIREVLDEQPIIALEEAMLEDLHEDVRFSEMESDQDESHNVFASKRVLREIVLESPRLELEKPSKYCPECGRKYPSYEVVCMECLVHLKDISDNIDVIEIKSNPQFAFEGENNYDSFGDLLSKENLLKINEFDFTIDDFSQIMHGIKSQAFKNFDGLVKSNEIDFDSLDILDKIILFTKSFVEVDYKSSGGELGYFETGKIFIDDRQTKSLQITTLIHELSHFLIQEIIIHILCKILNASRNALFEELAAFILSYTSFTQLIDEYSAHNVEGRFTIFGFQDYSSYLQIEKSLNGEMSFDEIEITKSIGNTFAVNIKEILESFIDRDLREDIKDQFLSDVLDRPNYAALRMENCQILNDEGFVKAIKLILNDGFEVACANIDNMKV